MAIPRVKACNKIKSLLLEICKELHLEHLEPFPT